MNINQLFLEHLVFYNFKCADCFLIDKCPDYREKYNKCNRGTYNTYTLKLFGEKYRASENILNEETISNFSDDLIGIYNNLVENSKEGFNFIFDCRYNSKNSYFKIFLQYLRTLYEINLLNQNKDEAEIKNIILDNELFNHYYANIKDNKKSLRTEIIFNLMNVNFLIIYNYKYKAPITSYSQNYLNSILNKRSYNSSQKTIVVYDNTENIKIEDILNNEYKKIILDRESFNV